MSLISLADSIRVEAEEMEYKLDMLIDTIDVLCLELESKGVDTKAMCICGGKPEYYPSRVPTTFYVACQNCNRVSVLHGDKDQAMQDWVNRSSLWGLARRTADI